MEEKRKIEYIGESFTTVYNSLVRDKELSLKARGLMLWIQSHDSEKFKFSKGSFKNISDKEKTDSINSALKELKDKGYLRIEKSYNSSGQFQWKYIFNKGGSKLEIPKISIPDSTIDGLSMHGSTVDGKPIDIRKNNKEIPLYIETEENQKFIPIEELKEIIENLKKSIPGYKPMFESQELISYRHLLENGFTHQDIKKILYKLKFIREHKSKDSDFYRKNPFTLKFLVGQNYQKNMLEQMVNLYENLGESQSVIREEIKKEKSNNSESGNRSPIQDNTPFKATERNEIKSDTILYGKFILHPNKIVSLPDGEQVPENEFFENQIEYVKKYK